MKPRFDGSSAAVRPESDPCDRDYKYGKGSACFYIRAPILDRPLSRAVLSQLELSPCVEEIIESLENDARQSRFNHIRDRQQVIRLERKLAL